MRKKRNGTRSKNFAFGKKCQQIRSKNFANLKKKWIEFYLMFPNKKFASYQEIRMEKDLKLFFLEKKTKYYLKKLDN